MTTYPNETYPADAFIEGLDGAVDAPTGLDYIAKGVGPGSSPTYEVQYNRRLHRQNAMLAQVRELMVVAEGGLAIGAYPGLYRLGSADKSFDGATGRTVTDNDVNYVYLDSANMLQVVTDATGWPTDPDSFVPLAEVTAAGGSVTAIQSVINRTRLNVRGRSAAFQVGAESGNQIDVTVQVEFKGGGPVNEKRGLDVWLSDAAGGGETATVPTGGISVPTGTLKKLTTTGVAAAVITNASGLAVVRISETGARTWYLNTLVDGALFSSAAITFA